MLKRSLYEYLKKIIEIHQTEGRGAIYKDLGVSKDYARHVFSKLSSMGFLKKVPGTWPVQYVPNYDLLERFRPKSKDFDANEEFIPPRQRQLGDPVEALEKIFEKLGDEPFTIHDIQCFFISKELRKVLDDNPTRFRMAGWRLDDENNQWQSPKYRINGRRRWIFARVSPNGGTQVFIQCTDDPIEVDLDSMMELMYTIGDFKNWLAFQCIYHGALTQMEAAQLIPPPTQWRVLQWHFGKDVVGLPEVSGFPLNNITLREWSDGYVRLYVKSRSDGHVRLEKIERPGKPEQKLTTWLGERASMAEALKQASKLAREYAETVKMNQETTRLLHEFSIQLQKHLSVLSAMEATLSRMNQLLEKLERGLGGRKHD